MSTNGRKVAPVRPQCITMLLENYPYPADVRVRREALALVAAGHDVTVVAPRAPRQPRREVIDGVKVRRLHIPLSGTSPVATLAEYVVATLLLHVAALRALIGGATVLHLHNPPDTLAFAGLVARATGRKVIFDHHDLFPELVEARIGPGRWQRGALLLERTTFRVANHVLAANDSHAEIARGRGDVPATKVTVVRNGPPSDTIVAAPRLRPGALRDPHLAYVGLLASQDGGAALPDLLRCLADDFGLPEAKLTIIGDGDQRQQIEARLRRLRLDGRARITGWLTHAEVRRLLEDADICIDPAPPSALNQRSTMMKIAEYMAAGKPIVAFDLLETRRTADTAVSVACGSNIGEMAASVALLARDFDERLRLARSGLERIPSLTWERSVERLLEAYARI